jgi:hypothetical protein
MISFHVLIQGRVNHIARPEAFLLRIGSLIVLSAFLFIRAQSSDFVSPGYADGGAAYLDLPLHAHAAALGQAVTAWRDDCAGLQYNPAVLDAANSLRSFISYKLLTDDRTQKGIDIACPAGQFFVLGVGANVTGVDKIEHRDEAGNPNTDDEYFSYGENEFSIAAAGRFNYNISLGVRAHYLYENFSDIDRGSAQGMGFDAGATWQPDSHVCIGLSGRNMMSWLYWETGRRDPVLAQARLGIAGIFLQRSLTTEIDVAKTLRQPVDVSCGIQYAFQDLIYIRVGGLTSIDVENRHSSMPDLSAGLGIRYNFFGCDYSVTIPTDDASGLVSYGLSLVLRFNTWPFK